MSRTKGRSRAIMGNLESQGGGLEGKGSGWSADDLCFHCISLISNLENSQVSSSEIWTCRSRVIRSNPTSDEASA